MNHPKNPHCDCCNDPEKRERFMQGVKEGRERGLVKVGVKIEAPNGGESREWLWAEPVAENQVRIKNIPFFADGIGQDDIVETSGDDFFRDFVRVIEHVTEVYPCVYDEGQATELYPQIREYFISKGIHVEGAVPGIAVLAVPVTMPVEELWQIGDNCPVPVKIREE